MVELTAVPDVDWAFDSWSGAVAGNSNPITVTVSGVTAVQANFSQIADTQAPAISDVVITPSPIGATVSWTTNEVADSQVEYGLTSSYTSVLSNATLVTSHSIVLTGLMADTLYHVEISSEDAALNLGATGDLTFTTLLAGAGGSAFQSDDFSGGTLDYGHLDLHRSARRCERDADRQPSADRHLECRPQHVGGFNILPRLQQAFDDGDFEIDFKFETTGIDYGQAHGILIEQDDINLIRFELNDNGEGHQILIANIFGSSGTVKQSLLLPSAEPIIRRARRTGDLFEFFYSIDGGANFISAYTQTENMTVNAISLHAGNWSGTAETVLIDYAFDTANPIIP